MSLHTLTATELLARLATREVSAVDAVRACIARIEAVDPAVNALPVRRFEAALDEARAADGARARGEGGPLCGLPITIKENLDLAGFDSLLGVTGGPGGPAKQDAPVVAALRQAGAIVLGKSNVAQLLLAQETESTRYGLTRNPFDLGRSPGGSSGGESAAVASGMAPLGLGTDIGGSVRIPCHFTGLYGTKGTVDRWPGRGAQSGVPGQEIVRSTLGPLARSAADVALAFRVLDPVALGHADPGVPPLPMPAPPSVAGLRIGWHDDDGYLTPTPAIQRAVRQARDVLEAAGATLVPIQPVDAGEVVFLWLAALGSDGGATMRARIEGYDFVPQLKMASRLARLPGALRSTLALVAERTGEARMARTLRAIGTKPVETLWQLTARRTAMRWAELDRWNEAGIDAMLCPAHVVPAMPHHTSGDFAAATSYTFRYSLLNFPAGIAPVTRVTAADVAATPPGKDRLERKLAAFTRDAEGLPIGVQVVARPWREEVMLALMLALDTGCRGQPDFPQTPVDPK
jgi:fatty acid amide hydrolase